MKAPLLSLVLASLAGCGAGAMRQAALHRECGAADPNCHRIGPLSPIAVGASFQPDVRVEIPGTTAPGLHLASTDASVVSVDGGALVGRAPGVSAVTIAVDSGVVVDFVHVWVAQPTAITLERDGGERIAGTVQLVAGEDLKLSPALWNRAQRLEGASALDWSIDCAGACPVALLRDGTPHRRRLRAQRPGKATITIAGLGLRETLDVEVVR
jgi:hypothetical protein